MRGLACRGIIVGLTVGSGVLSNSMGLSCDPPASVESGIITISRRSVFAGFSELGCGDSTVPVTLKPWLDSE